MRFLSGTLAASEIPKSNIPPEYLEVLNAVCEVENYYVYSMVSEKGSGICCLYLSEDFTDELQVVFLGGNFLATLDGMMCLKQAAVFYAREKVWCKTTNNSLKKILIRNGWKVSREGMVL